MSATAAIEPVSLDDVRAAAARIAPHAHRTPVMTCAAVDAAVGARVWFKCENLQKVGAFKFRGACNTVFSLTDADAARGVITHSSGNHAAALALAARLRGVSADIVMPDNAPAVKQRAVAGYGGHITLCAASERARESTVRDMQAASPRTLVHPYDDPRIIAGQGTAALELLEFVDRLDTLMTPVGGGGLLAGTAVASAARPGVRVYGAEPARADDAARSLAAGHIIPVEHPDTIADGLRTSLGAHNFPLIRAGVTAILTTSEAAIVDAMRFIWERMKLVVEPSAAVPLAALLENGVPHGCRHIGIVLSGGNVELDGLPWAR